MKLTKPVIAVDLSIILNAAYYIVPECSSALMASMARSMILKSVRNAATKNAQIVLATDLGDSWRKQYIAYKEGRPEKEQYYAIASKATELLAKEFDLLAYEGCEADDFAYIIAKAANEECHAVLVSSDNDWRLLSGLNDFTFIYNRSSEVFYSKQNFLFEIVNLTLKGSHNGVRRGVKARLTQPKIQAIADSMEEYSYSGFYAAVLKHLPENKIHANLSDNWYHIAPDLSVYFDELEGLSDYLRSKNYFDFAQK